MDKATDEVVKHFFEDSDSRSIVVEELGSENRSLYERYLVQTNKVDVQEINSRLSRMPTYSNVQTPEETQAERRVRNEIDSDDTYWIFHEEETEEVFGYALNQEEDGVTEMRILIDDEDYQGMRNGEKSFYDMMNEVRIDAAQGIPYVFNKHRNAQYKIENTVNDGRQFEFLKLGYGFKGFDDMGIMMALQNRQGEAPDVLYLPETDDLQLAEFVKSSLDGFYNVMDTEIRNSPDFDALGANDFGLQMDTGYATSRGVSKLVKPNQTVRAFEDSMAASEVVNELNRQRDKELERGIKRNDIMEVRLDAEAPETVEVAESLIEEDWIVSGFVPAIGGDYDQHELSLLYFNEPEDFYVTEGAKRFFDQLGVPYSLAGEDTDIADEYSIDAKIGF